MSGELNRLLRVASCGALGGTTNAWLCYFGIPVPVDASAHFKWHVIPAGAAHGAVLAALAFVAAALLSEATNSVRLVAAVPVGWLSGYASWIPLNRSAFDASWRNSAVWPLSEQEWTQAFWAPFAYFGLVALLYYLWLVTRGLREQRLWKSAAACCAAGMLGSLWWWLIWEHWYFSVLHGVLWGVLVGIGGAPRATTRVA